MNASILHASCAHVDSLATPVEVISGISICHHTRLPRSYSNYSSGHCYRAYARVRVHGLAAGISLRRHLRI